MRIRPAREVDLPELQQIELRAAEAFRGIGMDAIADDDPFSLDELAVYFVELRAWVAADEDDAPVAYLVAAAIDGNLHIEQVTVDPSAARQRIGAALIEHLAWFAREAGYPALTLTTFRDVPWNAPYYERLGFRTFTDIGQELAEVRRLEAERGLDRWPRVCMILGVAAE